MCLWKECWPAAFVAFNLKDKADNIIFFPMKRSSALVSHYFPCLTSSVALSPKPINLYGIRKSFINRS